MIICPQGREDCSDNPCKNGARCLQSSSKPFSCICQWPYYGYRCDRKCLGTKYLRCEWDILFSVSKEHFVLIFKCYSQVRIKLKYVMSQLRWGLLHQHMSAAEENTPTAVQSVLHKGQWTRPS